MVESKYPINQLDYARFGRHSTKNRFEVGSAVLFRDIRNEHGEHYLTSKFVMDLACNLTDLQEPFLTSIKVV
jgi:hypothetical protein